jgi:hypothetical protein
MEFKLIVTEFDGDINYILYKKVPVLFGLFHTWQLVADTINIKTIEDICQKNLK